MDLQKKQNVEDKGIYLGSTDVQGMEKGKYGWVLKVSSPLEDPLNLNDDWVYGDENLTMEEINSELEGLVLKKGDKNLWILVYDSDIKLIFVVPPEIQISKEEKRRKDQEDLQMERSEAKNLSQMSHGITSDFDVVSSSEDSEDSENEEHQEANQFWLELMALNNKLFEDLLKEIELPNLGAMMDRSVTLLILSSGNFWRIHSEILYNLVRNTESKGYTYRNFRKHVEDILRSRNDFNSSKFGENCG